MTIVHPGWGGGANWMGAAADPDTGIIYVPSINSAATAFSLFVPDPARSNFKYMAKLEGRLKGPEGLPLFKPPYAHVTAIDLNSGDRLWEIPIGDGPRAHPLLKNLNLPPLGDFVRGYPLLTKSLLFITNSGTSAPNFRAFNKRTGETIWEYTLPNSPSGTPMTYRVNGKQYIVLAAGGRDKAELIALSLP